MMPQTKSGTREVQETPAMRFEAAANLRLEFPPLPKTVLNVTKLLEDSGFMPDPRALARTLKGDPVITAAVLGRANSAYYGRPRRIDELHKAVLLIGFMDVTHIVLAAGFFRLTVPLHTPEQHRIFDCLLARSIGAARYAERIAAYLGRETHERARLFTLVLLHAVGRMILLYNRPTDYEGLWHIGGGRAPSAEQERAIFGVSHAEIGALALEEWGLPPLTARVVKHHLKPEALASRAENPPAGAETGNREAHRLALVTHLSVSAVERLLAAQEQHSDAETPSAAPAEPLATDHGEQGARGEETPDGAEENARPDRALLLERAAALCDTASPGPGSPGPGSPGPGSPGPGSPEALLSFIEEQRAATAAYVRAMTAAPSPAS